MKTGRQVLTNLMVKDDQVHSLTEIQAALEREGIIAKLNLIEQALERLIRLRSILMRTPNGYAFDVTTFPKILSTLPWLGDWIAINKETWLTQGDSVSAPAYVMPGKGH